MKSFLAKVKHYRGGDSVISRWDSRQEAQDVVDSFNEMYQTDNYYVEVYNPQKASGFGVYIP